MVLFRTLKSCVEYNHRLSSSYTDDEIENLGFSSLSSQKEQMRQCSGLLKPILLFFLELVLLGKVLKWHIKIASATNAIKISMLHSSWKVKKDLVGNIMTKKKSSNKQECYHSSKTGQLETLMRISLNKKKIKFYETRSLWVGQSFHSLKTPTAYEQREQSRLILVSG